MKDKFDLPVIPITTVADLRPIVENSRVEASAASRITAAPSTRSLEWSILASFVDGAPLSVSQTRELGKITSSVGDLVLKVSTPEGRALVLEFLGERDGQRVIAYLTRDLKLY